MTIFVLTFITILLLAIGIGGWLMFRNQMRVVPGPGERPRGRATSFFVRHDRATGPEDRDRDQTRP